MDLEYRFNITNPRGGGYIIIFYFIIYKLKRLLPSILFAAILTFSQVISACTETNNFTNDKKSFQKISSSLINVINQLESSQTKKVRSFSKNNVRVDEKGRIQIYINLYKLDKAKLDQLKTHGVEIDIYDKAENLVQGWASPQNIKAISELSFVKFIDLPTYGVSN